MPETTNVDPQNVDPHLTARIVGSYVRHHTVGTSQVSDLIASVHRALGQLGQHAQPEEVLTPAVSVRQSVRQDYVVCLDCGCRARTLRRHISTQHALSPDEYRKRWGLRKNHPLTAPAYSEQRSTMAKNLGFGRKPSMQGVTPAATAAAPVSADGDAKSEAKRTRRRSARSASKSADGAAPPTRKRRSTLPGRTPRG